MSILQKWVFARPPSPKHQAATNAPQCMVPKLSWSGAGPEARRSLVLLDSSEQSLPQASRVPVMSISEDRNDSLLKTVPAGLGFCSRAKGCNTGNN